MILQKDPNQTLALIPVVQMVIGVIVVGEKTGREGDRGRQRNHDFFLIMVDHVIRRILLFIRMLQRPISQSPQSHYRFS